MAKVLKIPARGEWSFDEVETDAEGGIPLKVMQSLVGGYIETVTLADDVVILCDEEGRLKDLPDNCEIGGVMFVGTILIVLYYIFMLLMTRKKSKRKKREKAQ